MPVGHYIAKATFAATAVLLTAGPVLADVKSGVDAWGSGNYDKAVKEWRQPALDGNADAQFNLGQAYKLGRGVKSNLDIAMDWYSKAARQGHLQASDSLGHLLHYKGRVSDALPYLEASSQRGEPRAQYLLATELFNGVNARKDWVRAYALMTRASSSGMSAASRSLAQMDKFIPLEQRQQGTVLAGKIEQDAGKVRAQQTAGFPINTAPAAPATRPVQVPSSTPAVRPVTTASNSVPGFPGGMPPSPGTAAPAQSPAPMPTPSYIPSAPKAPPVPSATTATATTAASGKYRIQLGAFGKEANARNLWTRLETRVGGLSSLQPYLKATGSVTRLQAGPFTTKGQAAAMCGKVKNAGQDCIVVTRF